MARALIASAAAFGITTVHALAFVGPRETNLVVLPLDAQSPRPTPPPIPHELRRRATSSTPTVLVGPDNTCGFVGGASNAAYTCNAGTDFCVFATSLSGTSGAVGCCNSNDCGFRVTCLDFTQISSSSACDKSCSSDSLTAKCTDSALRFCNTISFTEGVVDYFCNSESNSSPQLAFTTFSGETNARSFSPLPLTDSTSLDLTSLTSARSASATTSSSSSSSTTSAASGGGGGGGGGGGASANAGAIAGGVVGGVAVIGLIGLGILFLMRHNKKGSSGPAAAAAGPTQPTPPPMQQSPGPGGPAGYQPPPGHQSFYGAPDASKMAAVGAAAAHQPQHQQQYPANFPGGQPLQAPSPPAQYGQAYMVPNQHQQGHPGALVPGQPMVDRADAASPSSAYDNRVSQISASPGPYNGHLSQQSFPGHPQWQQPQPVQPPATVHEAGGNVVGGATDYNANHRGEMHELA